MLRGWPADRLFWWSCHPETSQHFGQHVAGHQVACFPDRLYPNRRLARQKSWFLERFWVPRAVGHFRKTLQALKPEVIWTVPHLWSIPVLARGLPSSGIRYHASVHDYPDAGSAVIRHGLARSARFAAQLDAIYVGATTRDAICAAMVEDLRQRTGLPGGINRAGLEAADLEFLRMEPPIVTERLRIAYAGTILVEDEFAFFAACLRRVRHQVNRPLTLEFWGAHSYRDRPWFQPDWMHEHGNLPESDLTGALRACSWGASPMAFHDRDPRYNRYSLPTKFISYLAAGLPIITLGHPESSVAKMAATYPVGLLQTTASAAEFCARLKEAFGHRDSAAVFRQTLLRCASVEFDAERMRAVLWDNLFRCAQGG
jgi:hypothetical protein